jgi:hypothetical protein
VELIITCWKLKLTLIPIPRFDEGSGKAHKTENFTIGDGKICLTHKKKSEKKQKSARKTFTRSNEEKLSNKSHEIVADVMRKRLSTEFT